MAITPITKEELDARNKGFRDIDLSNKYVADFDRAYTKRSEARAALVTQSITDALKAQILADDNYSAESKAAAVKIFSMSSTRIVELERIVFNTNNTMESIVSNKYTVLKNEMDANGIYADDVKTDVTAKLSDMASRFNEEY